MEPKTTVGVEGPLTEREVAEREFDARKYRPFAVTVSVTLHDIQGHLVKVNFLTLLIIHSSHRCVWCGFESCTGPI